MTNCVALIGFPLKHSVSPHFQQAAFDHYGLDVRYEAWEISEEYLEATVNRLRGPMMLGANVTIPYKERLAGLMDEVEKGAAFVGAVNTIVVRDRRLIGYNTDTVGFVRALRQDAGFDPTGKRAVILGAGGAARAVIFALLNEGTGGVSIVNRTMARAAELAAAVRRAFPRSEVVSLPSSGVVRDVFLKCDFIVNCTSVGMKHTPSEGSSPIVADLIPRDALVCDLVYNPVETPLLKAAAEAGAKTLGGVSMLVYQGAASFELWVEKEAPLNVMFRGARRALGQEDVFRT